MARRWCCCLFPVLMFRIMLRIEKQVGYNRIFHEYVYSLSGFDPEPEPSSLELKPSALGPRSPALETEPEPLALDLAAENYMSLLGSLEGLHHRWDAED